MSTISIAYTQMHTNTHKVREKVFSQSRELYISMIFPPNSLQQSFTYSSPSKWIQLTIHNVWQYVFDLY
jgi:hypothetical protein